MKLMNVRRLIHIKTRLFVSVRRIDTAALSSTLNCKIEERDQREKERGWTERSIGVITTICKLSSLIRSLHHQTRAPSSPASSLALNDHHNIKNSRHVQTRTGFFLLLNTNEDIRKSLETKRLLVAIDIYIYIIVLSND